MRLHDIKPNSGAKHRRKRLARGESSGLGKTAGRGHKGQKSRSGGGVRVAFEGGQMPLFRRLPKRGFNNEAFKTYYAVVNVGLLEERFEDGATIDETTLRQSGIVKGRYDGVKILGDGEVKKRFTLCVDRVSASAKAKIEAAGGNITEPEASAAPAPEAVPTPAAEPAPEPAADAEPPAAEAAGDARAEEAGEPETEDSE